MVDLEAFGVPFLPRQFRRRHIFERRQQITKQLFLQSIDLAKPIDFVSCPSRQCSQSKLLKLLHLFRAKIERHGEPTGADLKIAFGSRAPFEPFLVDRELHSETPVDVEASSPAGFMKTIQCDFAFLPQRLPKSGF